MRIDTSTHKGHIEYAPGRYSKRIPFYIAEEPVFARIPYKVTRHKSDGSLDEITLHAPIGLKGLSKKQWSSGRAILGNACLTLGCRTIVNTTPIVRWLCCAAVFSGPHCGDDEHARRGVTEHIAASNPSVFDEMAIRLMDWSENPPTDSSYEVGWSLKPPLPRINVRYGRLPYQNMDDPAIVDRVLSRVRDTVRISTSRDSLIAAEESGAWPAPDVYTLTTSGPSTGVVGVFPAIHAIAFAIPTHRSPYAQAYAQQSLEAHP